MNTKELVYQYLIEETRAILNDDFSLLTTTVISETLHISRSLTSQYLNELFAEGELIKISSRPVLYFDKQTLEALYKVENLDSEYLSINELMDTIQNSVSNDVFEEVIGHDGSLSQVIQQIKSSVEYPGRGLPLVLYGKRGSGKRYLVKTIYRYCLDEKILDENQIFYHLKVLSEQDNYEAMLFGDGQEIGLLERKDIGILYIENPVSIKKQTQYRLASTIRDGYYMRAKKAVRVNCRFIFGTTIDPNESLEYTLLQSLPIISNVPNFDQRSSQEKEQFIIKFFRQEQQRLGLKINISFKLLEILLQMKFEQDIHELEKCVTRVCANALGSVKEGSMNCHIYHLPEDKGYSTFDVSKDVETMISIDQYKPNDSTDRILVLFEEVIKSYKDFRINTLTYSEMLAKDYESMRNYYDLLIFENSYEHSQVNGLERIINNVLETKKSQNNINIPGNCSFVLSRMLLTSSSTKTNIEKWMTKNHVEITMLQELFKEEMHDVYMLSQEIARMIYQYTELTLNDFNLVFIILNVYFYNDDIKRKDTAAIIVSHGYSTASSIADAANQLLEEHVFDAFDMPLDSSSEEIIVKVNDYISMNPYYKNLILLVDMGSLELIGDKIISDINVGVINNISTAIALNIGNMIRQDLELEEILKKAANDATMKYKILNKAKKEKAILFVSDAGASVAERMVNLFKHSLPKTIDLRFLSYDFYALLTNGMLDSVFTRFDVILMVKPYSLPMENIRSVSLEDIVSFKDITVVDEALENYLNTDEIEVFNRNLLKNFSLQNVMQNLTILNANKLLDYVSDSTLNLERKMNRKFQSKTIVGIYIHVCFLIERLVTKTAIKTYENVDVFIRDQDDFIEDVNESFGAMLAHYNVELPVSEIALLYDYIVNDRNRNREEGDEF